ncbi:MAG: Hpt domain-containing protein [Lachnospiraceae bacterium]|nr:Hpt domain-containing protein [Lachnospiraceae bacterium]
MITMEKLKMYGANTDEGLARCVNNEALYLKLVGLVPNDENFGKLKEAAHAGDTDKVFEAAHAIKGALGNLSITPLYDKISDITEAARSKASANYKEMVDELMEMLDEFRQLTEEP